MSRFLEAGAPEWDSAIDGSRGAEPRPPGADEYDLRGLRDLPVQPPQDALRQIELLGSNNWAVAGSRTANGAALLANDMHLDYRVPIIWYRARLVQSGTGEALDVDRSNPAGHPVHRRRQQWPHRVGIHQ